MPLQTGSNLSYIIALDGTAQVSYWTREDALKVFEIAEWLEEEARRRCRPTKGLRGTAQDYRPQ